MGSAFAPTASNNSISPATPCARDRTSHSTEGQCAVVVAVTAVRMMQATIDEVVGVIAVRDCLVSATRAVLMALLGDSTSIIWRASVRISLADRDHMLDHGRSYLVMKVPVLQIVLMSIVANPRVPTIRSVRMRMRVSRVRLEFHMSSRHGEMLKATGSTIDALVLIARQP